MSFNELVLAIESADERCNTRMEKSFQVVEHAYDAFDVLCNEIELALMTEAKEDKSEEKNKASEGLIVKAKNMIKHLIDVLKEFISNICDSITSFLEKKENKEKIDNIEKLVGKNPNLKNIKVQVPDEKKMNGVFDKFIDKCDREITMRKAGRKAGMTANELDEEFVKSTKEASKVLIPITLASAIVILKSYTNKDYKNSDSVKRYEKDSLALEKELTPEIDPMEVKEIINFQKIRNRVEKQRASFFGNYFKDVFAAIKTAITGEDQVNTSIKDMKKGVKHMKMESTETEETVEVEESKLDEILDDVMKEVEESSNEKNTSEEEKEDETLEEADTTITESLVEDVNALRLEVYEAAHKGEITEEQKREFLDVLTLENYQ